MGEEDGEEDEDDTGSESIKSRVGAFGTAPGDDLELKVGQPSAHACRCSADPGYDSVC